MNIAIKKVIIVIDKRRCAKQFSDEFDVEIQTLVTIDIRKSNVRFV